VVGGGSFFDACDGCSFDFIPIHWYGNFEGLASHLGHYHVTFPDQKLWITELGYAHVDLFVPPIPSLQQE
jgi:hypothetical protein